LAVELADAGAAVGAIDADVDAGHPDRLARGRQASDVAELAHGDQRGQLAHSVELHQRTAAGLAARELT
jgi:Mrp family chromosome partitioning ATPase